MDYIRTINLSKFSWQNPVLNTINLLFDYDTYIAKSGDRFLFSELKIGQTKFPNTLTKNNIIWYDGIEWHEDIPIDGWRCYSLKDKCDKIFSNNIWEDFKSGSSGGGEVVAKPIIEVDTNIYIIDKSNTNTVFKIIHNNDCDITLPSIIEIKNDDFIEIFKTNICPKITIHKHNDSEDYIYEIDNEFIFNKSIKDTKIELKSDLIKKVWKIVIGTDVWELEK